jgi:pimeloyl-ACP methyl ester carboxylesterase
MRTAKGQGSGMMLRLRDAGRAFVLPFVGMLVLAAGAADGHDLRVSARDTDWALLVRADLEILGGVWLLSGRFLRAARIVALAGFAGILVYDLAQATAGHAPRPVFGRIVAGSGWVIVSDLVIIAGLLAWRSEWKAESSGATHAGRFAEALFVALALGVAIDRSQVGQFPIVATARAGRTGSGLDSLVYLPRGYYWSFRRWPLILTLHGRGEAGNDLDVLRHQGLSRVVEARGGLPFIVVAPQSSEWLWNVGALDLLLDEVIERYRVDPDRVYLTGNGMGGNGTWALACRRPERFAAVAPICGRGDPACAGRLRDVPTWAFHGAEDRIVPPTESERMVAALREAGGEARLTIYPDVGHDAWTPTYENPMFFEWLLQHQRDSASIARSWRSPE